MTFVVYSPLPVRDLEFLGVLYGLLAAYCVLYVAVQRLGAWLERRTRPGARAS